MHDNIKRFKINGQVSDDGLVKSRENLIVFLEGVMRDSGYVPSLDLSPQFTLSYIGDGIHDFELTVYGVKVIGDSWKLQGITSGKIV